jgi:hypothetical protein
VHLACASTPSTTITTLEASTGASTNSADGSILGGISSVGVRISLADAPPVTSSILAHIGSVWLIPCLAIHGAVNSLRDVIVREDVDDNLVADRGLSGRRRVAGVVRRLGGAGSSASRDAIVVRLYRGEGEELVAHVGVCFGYGIQRSVDGTAQSDGSSETGLSSWTSDLVVAIGTGDNDLE